MKLSEIMTRDVRSIDSTDTVQQAARIMKDLNVGSIPVTEGGRVVGMLTDRDVVLRNVADGKTPENTRVEEVMSKTVVTAAPDMDAHEAADIMAQNQIRRLPVMENDRMVGIVSIGDLAVKNIYENEAGEALSSISKPSRPSL